MTAAMLGMEESEIESQEEVYDVIRELSNIIGGNLKSGFVDAGLSCVLSTPSITNGMDFRVESLNIIQTQRFLFKYQDNTIIVDAGIKKEALEQAEEQTAPAEVVETAAGEGQKEDSTAELRNLNLLLGIPLEVTVELGRTRTRVHDLLKMGQGSVMELVQLDGEPVDLLVNDTLVAKGEVLVEREKYGIRIVEIVSRKERFRSLQ